MTLRLHVRSCRSVQRQECTRLSIEPAYARHDIHSRAAGTGQAWIKLVTTDASGIRHAALRLMSDYRIAGVVL